MLTKRCDKCGRVARVKPRVTRCKEPAQGLLGPTGYACWGKLTRVLPKPKPAGPTAASDALHAKLGKAHDELTAALRRMKVTLNSVTRWQRKISSIERAIRLKDHPEQVRPRSKPRTRIIDLPEDD